jgi:O-acetyl-ADP-ribose deacetylase (regulator of RNase III)
LEACYNSSLDLALEHGLKSIAFPNISTGVYHFPKDLAAEIAIGSVRHFLEEKKTDLKVIFVVYGQENLALYRKRLGDPVSG